MSGTSDSAAADAPLQVNTVSTHSFTVTEDRVQKFAETTGDFNPLHTEAEYAEDTMFGQRIAHGLLVGGAVSAALADMAGLIVYLQQDFEFRDAVPIGETVEAECEVVEDLGDDKYRVSTTVTNENDTVVLDGEAVIMQKQAPPAR